MDKRCEFDEDYATRRIGLVVIGCCRVDLRQSVKS